jgi:hypothetical protein
MSPGETVGSNYEFNPVLEKNVPSVGESKYLQLRFEFFNLFNHTQFDPAGITTDINAGPTFGQDLAARDPRLI